MDSLCSDFNMDNIGEKVLNDMELYLECSEDGTATKYDDRSFTALIGNNINLRVTFPKVVDEGNSMMNDDQSKCRYYCRSCKTTFHMETKFKLHMLQEHSIQRPFNCMNCLYTAECKKLLLKHIKRKHPPLEQIYIFSSESISCSNGDPSQDDEREKRDTDASKSVPSVWCSDVMEEIKNDDEISGNKSDTSLETIVHMQGNNKVTDDHMLKDHKKSFSCKECNFICEQKRTYDIHMKKHKGDHDFICSICDRNCFSRTALKRHGISHNEARPFKCKHDGCGKAFKHKGALNDHLRYVHSKDEKDKNYQKSTEHLNCADHLYTITDAMEKTSECAKSNTEESRSKPPSITSDAKPKKFKCTWKNCNQMFRDNYNMKMHLYTHKGERPLKCRLCDYRYIQKSSLKHHMEQHHSQMSQVCGKS